MGWIWTGCLGLSLVCAAVLGRTAALGAAVLEGARAAVTLTVSLAGPLCLWSGVCAAAEAVGVTQWLARLLSPLLRRLFPRSWQDEQVRGALCGNLCANLLGLGNAATPMGLAAVRGMGRLSGEQTASDEMCRFIVMNTASIQLIPTTVAAVRAGLRAASPFDILPAVWLTSLGAVTVGLLAAKGLSRWL